MAIYMKIPGVKGGVNVAGYKDSVELLDAEFGGIENPTHMQVGKSRDRFSGVPMFSEVAILKHSDVSTTPLCSAAHNGQVFPTIEIHHVKIGKQPVAELKMVLTNAVVTHYSNRSQQGGKVLESIRLSYSKIEHTFVPRDSSGKIGVASTVGYDLEAAQQL